MTATLDPILQAAIDELALPGILIGHRIIALGDEHALTPEEAIAFTKSVPAVRRASGAARIVARELLTKISIGGCSLPKASSGAPIWPNGVVGSMSHDPRIAVAAIALRRDYVALGIDIEPAEPLPSDSLDLIATPQERAAIDEDPYRGRLLFAAKEAVYKAVYPLDQTFLEHHDVQIDLVHRRATVRNGRTIDLQFCIAGHMLVVAFQRARVEAAT